jgi:hypothetical protein
MTSDDPRGTVEDACAVADVWMQRCIAAQGRVIELERELAQVTANRDSLLARVEEAEDRAWERVPDDAPEQRPPGPWRIAYAPMADNLFYVNDATGECIVGTDREWFAELLVRAEGAERGRDDLRAICEARTAEITRLMRVEDARERELREVKRERDEQRAQAKHMHAANRDLYALWLRVVRAMTPRGGSDITDEQVAERAERAEAQAAQMRAVIQRTENHGLLHDVPREDCPFCQALTTDAGKGWVPPEQAAAMRAALEAARSYIGHGKSCPSTLKFDAQSPVCDCGAGGAAKTVDAALATDVGRGLLERVARYERALRTIAHGGDHPDDTELARAALEVDRG